MSTSTTDRNGRPKKSPLEVRNRQTKIRLNLLEEAELRHRCDLSGMDLATYVRESALNHEITVPAVRSADPELVTKLDRLGQEVRAIGNLTNQIAIAAHTDRRLPPEWRNVHERIDALRSEISTTLNKVVIGE